MLKNLKLHNFKSHQDTEISFDDSRLHALVGQNSSGKTSILQALYYFARTTDSAFDEIFVGQSDPAYISTIGQDNLFVEASGCSMIRGFSGNWKARYGFYLSKFDGSWCPSVSFDDGQEKSDRGWKISLHDFLPSVPEDLKSAVHLKLSAANLAKATYSEDIVPQMEFDGTRLAPTLDYLRNEAPENFQILQDKLKQVVPGVVKIGIRRAKVLVSRRHVIEVNGRSIPYEEPQEMVGQEVILDMNTGERIPAHALSEGTVLTLGLLTVLQNPKKPSLLLLDDIEQGLHPKAQRDLIAVFKEIINDNPELQIIFSTHSPYIVDELEPSQVHVLSNKDSGFTRCKRLDEHPDIEWAKKTLTTGEFWDAEGEDWVASGEADD